MLPRGRAREVETVSLDDGMLHVPLGEEIVQCKRHGRFHHDGVGGDESVRATTIEFFCRTPTRVDGVTPSCPQIHPSSHARCTASWRVDTCNLARAEET